MVRHFVIFLENVLEMFKYYAELCISVRFCFDFELRYVSMHMYISDSSSSKFVSLKAMIGLIRRLLFNWINSNSSHRYGNH